jgi:tetratricopeptide (TPR) repeat protein
MIIGLALGSAWAQLTSQATREAFTRVESDAKDAVQGSNPKISAKPGAPPSADPLQPAEPKGIVGSEPSGPRAENPGTPAEGQAQSGQNEGGAARGPALLGGGLKNVLNLISGNQPSPSEALEKGSNEEAQRRVNELVRSATINIEKGRTPEAVKNINDLITLKPYEADFHFALGLSYRREGKYKEAMKKYQDVLDLGGPRSLVALFKAEASASEGKTDKVFEFLKEAAIGGRNIINDVGTLPLLSNYQHDTEFIKLALHLENFPVSNAKNHDPFTNPFPRLENRSTNKTEESPNEISLSPEDQEKLLQDAKKTMERVQFYIKLDDETKAMKAYSSLRELSKKKDLLTIPKLVNDFRILIARLEEVEVRIEGIRLKYYYNQAQSKLKQMKELFTDGEYQRVEIVHSEVIKLTQEMEQTNTHYKPVADRILAASSRWLTRAQVRQEFQSHKPNIQGIVISENAKMAVLNDRIIKQGEAVDDFRVVKVESNKVTFRYKGEEIPLIFRRY